MTLLHLQEFLLVAIGALGVWAYLDLKKSRSITSIESHRAAKLIGMNTWSGFSCQSTVSKYCARTAAMQRKLPGSEPNVPKRKSYTDPEGVCVVTSVRGVDLHHIKTRGAGGTDDAWNLMPLAHEKHVEVHVLGLAAFVRKYSQVKRWLTLNGWERCELKGTWFHA